MSQRRRRQIPREAEPASRAVATRRYAVALILALTLLLAAIVHSPAFSNGFLDFDDPEQVVQNESIRAITAHNVGVYFTTPVLGMYSPLTSLSYAVDYSIGGLNVATYHATNLLLHLVSVCLVCFIVLWLTESVATAAVATALFALHPANVAAVAPVMCRSGLLSSCFYLAAYAAYLSYVRTRIRPRLVLSFVLFLLAVLSKVPAIVFPVLLVLTDYYQQRTWSRKIVIEKIPYFLVSLVFGWLAVVFRPDMAAMKGSLLDYSLFERFCLAAYSLVVYLGRLVAPVGLSPLYPYPNRVNGYLPWPVYVAPVAALLGVWLAARVRSRRRLLVFGGGFILIHLALVLKVVPLGVEFMADRYLYLPGIGLFIIAAELARGAIRPIRRVSLAGFVAVVLLFSVTSHGRYADWKDSITFYTRTLDRYPDSAVAHNNLGGALDADHRSADAFVQYQMAVRLEPGYVPPHINLGNALVHQGRAAEAVPEFIEALRLEPASAKAHAGLGHAFARMGRPADAIAHLSESARLDPAVAETHVNLGVVLDSQGRVVDAIAQYAAALALDPTLVEAHTNLGSALAVEGRLDEARAHFSEALRLNPDFADAHYNLAVLLANSGDRAGAVRHLEAAVRLAPDHQAAQRLLDALRRLPGER